MKNIRVLVKNFDNRIKMIEALAMEGYPVWVEETKVENTISLYEAYVCFEVNQQGR